jgi:hypothetical protein
MLRPPPAAPPTSSAFPAAVHAAVEAALPGCVLYPEDAWGPVRANSSSVDLPPALVDLAQIEPQRTRGAMDGTSQVAASGITPPAVTAPEPSSGTRLGHQGQPAEPEAGPHAAQARTWSERANGGCVDGHGEGGRAPVRGHKGGGALDSELELDGSISEDVDGDGEGDRRLRRSLPSKA